MNRASKKHHFNRLWIAKLSTVAAVLLTVIVISYGLYLLIVGETRVIVNEGETVRQTVFVPHEGGIFPLVGGIALFIGLLTRRALVAWLGFVLVAAFSMLFLFGIGGRLLPVSAILLLLLIAIALLKSQFLEMLSKLRKDS
jgi:hypothetical protein